MICHKSRNNFDRQSLQSNNFVISEEHVSILFFTVNWIGFLSLIQWKMFINSKHFILDWKKILSTRSNLGRHNDKGIVSRYKSLIENKLSYNYI